MNKVVEFFSRRSTTSRRGMIMVMDLLIVLASIPISLSLSLSNLSFDPFSPPALAAWTFGVIFCHLLFRFNGLYNTIWRFASTQDFFNIIRSCAMMALVLYAIRLGWRGFQPMTGLNERQFIVFFIVTFTLISAPRLMYRFMREGASWQMGLVGRPNVLERRALLLGNLSEADIIARFAHSSDGDGTRLVGILCTDDNVTVGTRLQRVPVIATPDTIQSTLEGCINSTTSIDLLIVGNGIEKDPVRFSEAVRMARRAGIAVAQFSGISQIGPGGRLVLQSVDMETILRRETVAADVERISDFLKGRRILVTGGAGSIGRTLVRRALELGVTAVHVCDLSEFGIFKLHNELDEALLQRLSCRIVDICDRPSFQREVRRFKPDVIFHAAALKHVPLLEDNWQIGIRTNVFGTAVCAEVAMEEGVGQFILISSDKAVEPTSVLGMTKCMAEEIVRGLHDESLETENATRFSAVRFGNVFGSDGSVAHIFERQIAAGGPVTVTDPDMERFMMSISEAVDLVIMAAVDASSRSASDSVGIYMLDMGEPVRIIELAENMIRMAGKQPYRDIEILSTGIRAGEKLTEALTSDDEEIVALGYSKLFGLRKPAGRSWAELRSVLLGLRVAVGTSDRDRSLAMMRDRHPAPFDAANDIQHRASATQY